MPNSKVLFVVDEELRQHKLETAGVGTCLSILNWTGFIADLHLGLQDVLVWTVAASMIHVTVRRVDGTQWHRQAPPFPVSQMEVEHVSARTGSLQRRRSSTLALASLRVHSATTNVNISDRRCA